VEVGVAGRDDAKLGVQHEVQTRRRLEEEAKVGRRYGEADSVVGWLAHFRESTFPSGLDVDDQVWSELSSAAAFNELRNDLEGGHDFLDFR